MRPPSAHPLRDRLPVALLLLATATCGGGDEPERTADTASGAAGAATSLEDLDACELLTAEEIRAATGHEPGPGSDPIETLRGGAPMCAWPSADGSVAQVAQVLVSWASADTFEDYRASMEAEGISEFREVEGPGRFNVLLDEVNIFQAFGERYMVQIAVEPASGHDPLAAATQLARAALGRVE